MKRTAIVAGAAAALAFSTAASADVFIDLGVLEPASPSLMIPTSVVGNLAPGELVYISFTLPIGVDGSAGFLDITSNASGNQPSPLDDSELGFYAGPVIDPNAPLVASDDDDGIGLYSTLSFGQGSGMMLGDSFNLGGDGIANGEDGALAAGQYTLVLGEFNTEFGSVLGDATGSGSDGGDYEINLFYAIPEPTSLSLAALGGLTLLRRRR